MILFISSWHLVALLGVFLGFAALLGVWGILWAARAALDDRQDADQAKREKRSAAAKQGHATRRAKVWTAPQVGEASVSFTTPENETERVLRQIDAQAEAKAK